MASLQRVSQSIANALKLRAGRVAAPPLVTRRVKCLTLNVLASPVPFNRMERERLQCLLAQIEEQQYDVVAFQELQEREWGGVARKKEYLAFVEALQGLGFLHRVAGPAPRLTAPLDGGTAIFSKHPIVAQSLHPWEEQVSWDSWASKGVVRAQLEVAPPPEAVAAAAPALPGFPFVPSLPAPARLHVVTLHAQASHAGWQDTAGEARYRSTRVQQMRQLTQVLREQATDGEAVLAFGDFNFNARDIQELVLHQSQLADGTGRSRPPLDVVAETFGGHHPVTFGAKDIAGRPKETFLTCKVLRTAELCLDHVYFWPAERGAAGYPHQEEVASAAPSSRGFVLGKPRCTLEVCPYRGPSGPRGKRPTQVSDHYGWAVEFDVAWRLPERSALQFQPWKAMKAFAPWDLADSPYGGPTYQLSDWFPPEEAMQPTAGTNMLQRMWQRVQNSSQWRVAAA